ncbi:hypothetical protein GPECTOR_46g239 [Gonium pectorale]|uniref:Guanylate cyclase domain-containing protein n=1 Tax=Gonium pectorale TaxID=33097 RepID=A0A150G9Z7_GONPE|nr:hypothetical protein GPECTOR_46g239 [Gonium pectorale]|eukprot:KXZ46170.1 hypothetical protein GPECTOR_46g239 [Gonium pectorale]
MQKDGPVELGVHPGSWAEFLNGAEPVVLVEFCGEGDSAHAPPGPSDHLRLDVDLRGLLAHATVPAALAASYAGCDAVRLCARFANAPLRSLLQVASAPAYEALLAQLLCADPALSEALKDCCVALLEGGAAAAAPPSQPAGSSHPLVVQHPLPHGTARVLLPLTLHPVLLRYPPRTGAAGAGDSGGLAAMNTAVAAAAAAGMPPPSLGSCLAPERRLVAAVALRYSLSGGLRLLHEQVGRMLAALSGMPAAVTLLTGDGRAALYQNAASLAYMGLRQGCEPPPPPLLLAAPVGAMQSASVVPPDALASPGAQPTTSIASFLIDGCEDEDAFSGGGNGMRSARFSVGTARHSAAEGARGRVPHLLAKPPPPPPPLEVTAAAAAAAAAAAGQHGPASEGGHDSVLQVVDCSWEQLALLPHASAPSRALSRPPVPVAAPGPGPGPSPGLGPHAPPPPPPRHLPSPYGDSHCGDLASTTCEAMRTSSPCGSAMLLAAGGPSAIASTAPMASQRGSRPSNLSAAYGSNSTAPAAAPSPGGGLSCPGGLSAGGGLRGSTAGAHNSAGLPLPVPLPHTYESNGTMSYASREGMIDNTTNSSNKLLTLFIGGGFVAVTDSEHNTATLWAAGPPAARAPEAADDARPPLLLSPVGLRMGMGGPCDDGSIGTGGGGGRGAVGLGGPTSGGSWQRDAAAPPGLPQQHGSTQQQQQYGASLADFRSGLSSAVDPPLAPASDDRSAPRSRGVSPYASAPSRHRGALPESFLADLPEGAVIMQSYAAASASVGGGGGGGGGGSAGALASGLVTRGLSQSVRQSIELRRSVLGVGRAGRSPAENPLSTSTWGLVAEGSMRSASGLALKRNTSFGAAVLRAGTMAPSAELARSSGGGGTGGGSSATRSARSSTGMLVPSSVRAGPGAGGSQRPSEVVHDLVIQPMPDRSRSRSGLGSRAGTPSATTTTTATTAGGVGTLANGGAASSPFTIGPTALAAAAATGLAMSPRTNTGSLLCPFPLGALGSPSGSGAVRRLESMGLGSRMTSKALSGMGASAVASGVGGGPDDADLLSSGNGNGTATGMATPPWATGGGGSGRGGATSPASAAAAAAAVVSVLSSLRPSTTDGLLPPTADAPPPRSRRLAAVAAARASAEGQAPGRGQRALAAATPIAVPLRLPGRGTATIDDVAFVELQLAEAEVPAADAEGGHTAGTCTRTQSSTLGHLCSMAENVTAPPEAEAPEAEAQAEVGPEVGAARRAVRGVPSRRSAEAEPSFAADVCAFAASGAGGGGAEEAAEAAGLGGLADYLDMAALRHLRAASPAAPLDASSARAGAGAGAGGGGDASGARGRRPPPVKVEAVVEVDEAEAGACEGQHLEGLMLMQAASSAHGYGNRHAPDQHCGSPRGSGASDSGSEGGACWHEVTLTPLGGPGPGPAAHGTADGSSMLLLMQTDVTPRVRAERAIAEVLEAEHTLLESIFPRHVLEMAASSARQGKGKGKGAAAAGGAGGAVRYRLTQLPLAEASASIATYHPMVTILFADIKGFTTLCHSIPPTQVMQFLNHLYSRLDTLLDVYGVYKVETIGGALPEPRGGGAVVASIVAAR